MYKLVPVEPTEEMIDACRRQVIEEFASPKGEEGFKRIISAMLSVAPNPCRPIAEAEEYKDGHDVLLYGRYGVGTGFYDGNAWVSETTDECGERIALEPTHFIPLEWLEKVFEDCGLEMYSGAQVADEIRSQGETE